MPFGVKIVLSRDCEVDIFYFYRTPGGDIVPNRRAMEAWPKEWYRGRSTFPLVTASFESMTLPVPRDPHDFLSRAYGEKYRTEARVFHAHVGKKSSLRDILEAAVLYVTGPVSFSTKSLVTAKKHDRLGH